MIEDTTLIDHESAVKALAALEVVDAADVVIALSNVLKRKLGQIDTPVPNGEDLTSKFEHFFDIIFEVAPERKALPVQTVVELVDVAIAALEKDIEEERPKPIKESLLTMYVEDLMEYQKMRSLLMDGDTMGAVKTYRNMDTACRDLLFGRNRTEEVQLFVFFEENGY